jgi:hypothetical protein
MLRNVLEVAREVKEPLHICLVLWVCIEAAAYKTISFVSVIIFLFVI